MRGNYRNLSEEEKMKKRNFANFRNKNILDVPRERKKEHMKKYYYKSKHLLNNLINCVEQLEGLSLSK